MIHAVYIGGRGRSHISHILLYLVITESLTVSQRKGWQTWTPSSSVELPRFEAFCKATRVRMLSQGWGEGGEQVVVEAGEVTEKSYMLWSTPTQGRLWQV